MALNKINVINVRLDDDTLAEIDRIAKEEDRPRANLLMRLIKEALDSRKTAVKAKERSAEMTRRAAKRKKRAKGKA